MGLHDSHYLSSHCIIVVPSRPFPLVVPCCITCLLRLCSTSHGFLSAFSLNYFSVGTVPSIFPALQSLYLQCWFLVFQICVLLHHDCLPTHLFGVLIFPFCACFLVLITFFSSIWLGFKQLFLCLRCIPFASPDCGHVFLSNVKYPDIILCVGCRSGLKCLLIFWTMNCSMDDTKLKQIPVSQVRIILAFTYLHVYH